jgi:hypothetical protein
MYSELPTASLNKVKLTARQTYSRLSSFLWRYSPNLGLGLPTWIFFNSHSGGWSPSWVNSARRPLNRILYLPRVIMMMEDLVEWRLAGETEVIGENLSQRQFVHHKPHLTRPGLKSDRRGGKPATNRLSYGAALPPWKSPVHFAFLGLLGMVMSLSQGLYLYTNTEKRTHTHTHKHYTSMPWVGFVPTIPASERAKTVHDLDGSATVTGQDLVVTLIMRYVRHEQKLLRCLIGLVT